MRKAKSSYVWATIVALVLGLGAVTLVGCGSVAEEQPAEEAQGQGQDGEASEEQDAQEQAEAESGQKTEASEPVWVMSGMVSHSEVEGRDPSDSEYVYELDDAGNFLKVVLDGKTVATYERDENGYATGAVYGEMVDSFENEFDDQGRLLVQKGSDSTSTYTYDENGFVTKAEYVSLALVYNADGEIEEGSEYEMKVVDELDENGLVTSSTTTGDTDITVTTYTYEYDENGMLASRTAVSSTKDLEGNAVEGSEDTATTTYTCDEHGNIVESVGTYPWGTRTTTYTYTLIENPSPAARMDAHMRQV